MLSAGLLSACSRAPAPTIDANGNLIGPTPGAAGLTQMPGSNASPGATNSPGATGSPGSPAGPVAGGPSSVGSTPGGDGSADGGGGGSSAGPTSSHLFTPTENTIGITPTQITLCAHAALTYGAAFNTSADDFNVFWSALNDKGGVYGRKVVATYENDNYTATDARTAAVACHAKNPFMLLGGIGFDQIPAVRNYVETVHMLYLHHTATIQGTAGQKYSFSELPTVERMGEAYAQLAATKWRDKRFGIIERSSPNWRPGTDAFKAAAKRLGLNIVKDVPVEDKQGNYTNEILAMKNAGAEVVFGWENALNSTELIKQAKAQLYSPQWLIFGINLMSQTLGSDALNPPLVGSVMFTPYSYHDYTGSFAPYADDVKQFEAEYAKYRPNTDLTGVGGDLLFLNWTGQKSLYKQLLLCGKDCTRNRFVDVLRSYHARPTSSACMIDFPDGDGYHGSTQLNFIEAYQSPSGKVNFRNMQPCVDR